MFTGIKVWLLNPVFSLILIRFWIVLHGCYIIYNQETKNKTNIFLIVWVIIIPIYYTYIIKWCICYAVNNCIVYIFWSVFCCKSLVTVCTITSISEIHSWKYCVVRYVIIIVSECYSSTEYFILYDSLILLYKWISFYHNIKVLHMTLYIY